VLFHFSLSSHAQLFAGLGLLQATAILLSALVYIVNTEGSAGVGRRARRDREVWDGISADATAVFDATAVDFVDADYAGGAFLSRCWRWYGKGSGSREEEGQNLGEHRDCYCMG
jgi:hypothetical protein